ncbi:MAG: hypothetical protein ACD_60C00079G0051 [uncultured bacterium]|nr:MAG: hypothetical protein ACD_60C00079G0051 [uncultured bacterium]
MNLVHRRTGGLEKGMKLALLRLTVHRRTGGLEK